MGVGDNPRPHKRSNSGSFDVHDVTPRDRGRSGITLSDMSYGVCHPYKAQIPRAFHPYLVGIRNVKGDGNCGFRAVAVALGYEEDHWSSIRHELLQELENNREYYSDMLMGAYGELRQSLDWNGTGFAPKERWMSMPNIGLLIANRFRVIVVMLTTHRNNSNTTFPTMFHPEFCEPHRFVTIAYVDDGHFITVQLDGYWPLPCTSLVWNHSRSATSEDWRRRYHERLQMYENIVAKNRGAPDYVNVD